MKNVLRDTLAVQEPAAVRNDGGSASPDEIDLLAYVRACWRSRYVLLAVAVIVGIATYAVNRAITPTWQAQFRLIASEPATGGQPGSSVSMATFRELVASGTAASALIREFQLDRAPYRLTPERFLRNHVTVDLIRDSSIIRVAVRLTDRDLAVKVAQRYAQWVVAAAQRINVESINDVAGRIKEQRDTALERLTASERALEEYRRRTQIELLRKDVDTMLAKRPEALDLTVEVQGERARVKQGEAELAKQQEVRTVKRTIDSLPAAEVPAARGSAAPGSAAPGSAVQGSAAQGSAAERLARDRPREMQFRSEVLDPYVNPVYEALQRDVTQARTRLAGLEQERRELVQRLQLDAPTAAKLNRLYEAETGLAALTRAQEVSRTAYVSAAEKYEDARLQSTVRSSQLHILDQAFTPDAPVAPRAVRNTAAVVLLALTLACVVVIAMDRPRPVASRT